MTRARIPWLAGLALPLVFALLSVPVAAQAPSVTLDSPAPGAVVEGDVLFQGTAEDPDSDLDRVTVTVDGGGSRVRSFSSGTASADWEVTWNSQNVPDGRRLASVVARDQNDALSAFVNITLIVDNDKQPSVRNSQLRFDALNDQNWAPWNDMGTVPTTRLSLDLDFSEVMRDIRGAVNFTGGEARWDVAQGVGSRVWLNISYLQTNTSYTIAVGTTAADLAGNPLRDSYEIAFTTTTITTPGTPDPGPGIPFLEDLLRFLPFDLLPFNLPWWVWVGGAVAAIVMIVTVVRRIRRRGGSKARRKRKKGKRGKE